MSKAPDNAKAVNLQFDMWFRDQVAAGREIGYEDAKEGYEAGVAQKDAELQRLLTAGDALLRALDEKLWTNDYCGLESSNHDAPAINSAIKNFRAALNP